MKVTGGGMNGICVLRNDIVVCRKSPLPWESCITLVVGGTDNESSFS